MNESPIFQLTTIKIDPSPSTDLANIVFRFGLKGGMFCALMERCFQEVEIKGVGMHLASKCHEG